jgi:hypothetical protein
LHAAPAVASVTIENAVPRSSTPASVGGDDTFGQILRSVQETDEAATFPRAINAPAISVIRQTVQQRAPWPQSQALGALALNPPRGTNQPRTQKAGSSVAAKRDTASDRVAGSAVSTADAAVFEEAVIAAPLPEATPVVAVESAQDVAVSEAPDAEAPVLALPPDAAALSAVGKMAASNDADPADDAAANPARKTSSAGSVGTLMPGSTSLPQGLSAQPVLEALGAASSQKAVSSGSKALLPTSTRFEGAVVRQNIPQKAADTAAAVPVPEMTGDAMPAAVCPTMRLGI